MRVREESGTKGSERRKDEFCWERAGLACQRTGPHGILHIQRFSSQHFQWPKTPRRMTQLCDWQPYDENKRTRELTTSPLAFVKGILCCCARYICCVRYTCAQILSNVFAVRLSGLQKTIPQITPHRQNNGAQKQSCTTGEGRQSRKRPGSEAPLALNFLLSKVTYNRGSIRHLSLTTSRISRSCLVFLEYMSVLL